MPNRKDAYEIGLSLLGGAGLGAVMMYLLDPDLGNRRRRKLRSAASSAVERSRHLGESAGHSFSENVARLRDRMQSGRQDFLGRSKGPSKGLFTGSALGALASQWIGRAGERGSETYQQMRDRGSEAYEGLRERGSRAYQRLRQSMPGRSRFFGRQHVVEEQPSASAYGTLLGSSALGMLAMYLLDPRSGRRRRSLIRDKAVKAYHRSSNALDVTSRYARDQARGFVAETRRFFQSEGEVSDDKLIARVRTALGRCSSHPSAIEVEAHQGRVILRGPVLSSEADDVVDYVKSVPGVQEIDSQLEFHESAENIPALQGPTMRPAQRPYYMQEYWSPTTRMTAGIGGAALMLGGLRRGGISGTLMTTLGCGLCARGITNLSFSRLTGISAGRRGIDVQKTININAPIDKVFNFFTDYDNLPHYMTNVKECRVVGEGRIHWKIAGPAGATIDLPTLITNFVPNKLVAWKSEEGSLIGEAGIMRFDENPDGSTRVDIKFTYNPPAGLIGHGIATLFGSDPKHEMDEDLLRMKTSIETGHPPHDAAQPLHTSQSSQ